MYFCYAVFYMQSERLEPFPSLSYASFQFSCFTNNTYLYYRILIVPHYIPSSCV